jgi:hypothetical protein
LIWEKGQESSKSGQELVCSHLCFRALDAFLDYKSRPPVLAEKAYTTLPMHHHHNRTLLYNYLPLVLLDYLTLELGSLGGCKSRSQTSTCLSYKSFTRRIIRVTAWVSNFPSCPEFGEYFELMKPSSDLANTGVLLRALSSHVIRVTPEYP